MTSTTATTPLHDLHAVLGARMVPFAGYLMPLQYPGGSIAEHTAVRTRAGLFDVSHMGELIIRGPEAHQFVDMVTTAAVARIAVGQVRYAMILTPQGTIVDDCLIYRRADEVMLVVNAANRAAVLEHFYHYADRCDCTIEDASDRTALLALQGPLASGILAPLAAADPESIGYYRFVETEVAGVPTLLSRTGYTGEDGFELYVAADDAAAVWTALLGAGDVTPAGLGARDSLRLEAGMPLYGHELDATTTPLDAGLAWVVDFTKPSFIGHDALVTQRAAGPTRRLVGFRAAQRAVPRAHYPIHADGALVGEVASGAMSPTLGVAIGTAYVPTALAAPGTVLHVDIRGTQLPVTVVQPPFVPHRTRR
jgi:aminomethyltransferase